MAVRSIVLACLAAALLVAPGASGLARTPETSSALVSPADMLLAARPFQDALVREPYRGPRRLAYTSGRYLTPDGVPVEVHVSERYTNRDATANQALVDFLGWLVHGGELARVTLFVETPEELAVTCGSRAAVACYSPAREWLFIPGEDRPGLPVVHVLAHEYGHHIAVNRSNLPWAAGFYGPKRWASYMNICRRAARGQVFPGDQGDNYERNPGEGWAEAYRRLNEVRAGNWPAIGWPVVHPLFMPDNQALARISQDVLQPWTRATRRDFGGRLTRAGSVTRVVSTPLDGTVRARVTGPRGTTVTIREAGRRALTRTGATVTGTICGQRQLRLVVTAKAPGAYRLSVWVP